MAPFLRSSFGLTGPRGDLELGWAVSSLGWGALAGNVAAGAASDRYGRRTVLTATAALFLASALLAAFAPDVNPRLVLLALIGFVASFAMSLGPVTWVLLSEIFPNENRAVAVSVVAFWNSLVSAGVTLLFPWQLSTIGPAATFLGYGLFAIAALIVVLRFVPETRGRTLEELERELVRANPASP